MLKNRIVHCFSAIYILNFRKFLLPLHRNIKQIRAMKESEILYVLQSDIMYDWDDDGKSLDVCFNRETKEVENVYQHCGIWYTRDGMCKYEPNKLTVYEAIKAGVLNKEQIVNACFDCLEFDKHIESAFDKIKYVKLDDLSIPCSVNGGRKYRGVGTLLNVFPTPAYKSWLQPTYKAVVKGESGEEHVVTSIYVEFDEKVKDNLLTKSKDLAALDLHRLSRQFAYRASYSSCDSETFYNYFVGCLLEAMKLYNQEGEYK